MSRHRNTSFAGPLLVLVLLPAGCREASSGPPPTSGDIVPMTIGSETFNLEVADSKSEQQRGLMYRDSMPADHGMIFVFPDEEEREFWMESTFIPLDILYLDASGRVVSIKPMKPRDRTAVASDGPAMYAIELNQGTAARVGVRPGDVLEIPQEILKRQPR